MRNRFDRQLLSLSNSLIEMATLIEDSLERIILFFKKGDENTFAEIISNEKQVDHLESEIQTKALKLICSQQPVASDLRAVSTALSMITDMERISDQAVDIAEIIVQYSDIKMIKDPVDIVEMTLKCQKMLKKSIQAFLEKNIELAKQVIEADDEVDILFLKTKDELIALIELNKNNGSQAIDLIMIAKYLERIADHSVNIAEWVIFNITGEHKNQQIM